MTGALIHLLTLAAVSTAASVVLPAPDGQYGTASVQMALTDHSRQDPYAMAAGKSHFRQVVVSSFYPAALRKDCVDFTSQYMPSTTANFYDQEWAAAGVPNGTFASLQLTQCKARDDRSLKNQKFPAVLFSPGLGNSRLVYSAMAQELASKGNIVISIDHPYDADIVEFPDGSTILAANISTDAQIEAAVDVRTQDVAFLLDQLRSDQISKQLLGGKVRINQKKYSVYGHSLGGATAVEAASSDERLTAGINLDGTLFGSIVSCGATKPLLIMSHAGKNLTTDPSWTSAWDATRKSTKAVVTLPNTTHGSYTDYPLIVDALGVPAEVRGQFDELIGSVSGSLLRTVIAEVVDHFIDYSQCREKSALPKLNGTSLAGLQLLGESDKAIRCR